MLTMGRHGAPTATSPHQWLGLCIRSSHPVVVQDCFRTEAAEWLTLVLTASKTKGIWEAITE